MNAALPDEGLWISLPEALHAWKNGDGEGVKIAILDSGVDLTHPKLAGLELVDDLAIVDDGHRVIDGGEDVFGHGTAIAHIIRTIAPAAKIGSFRVLGPALQGKGEVVRAGVQQAMERGYHILNCSFGFKGKGYSGKLRFVERHKEWLDKAYLEGIHVVAAGSNLGHGEVEWPSHFANSISVDKTKKRCEDEDFFYRPGSLVEFVAKGHRVEVPWLNHSEKIVDGTSYATPRVAAWMARLLSAYPSISPPQMKALLRHIALERRFI